LRFRGGHRGRADMIGEHGYKTIWLVYSKTEVTYKAGILGSWENRPEMTV
jgi:hypothetical protein